MKRLLAALACAGLAFSAPAFAQSNDDDYTPLNSRIKRDRQFPTEPKRLFQPRELSEVQKKRSQNMGNQFSKCLWDRSNEKALDLLGRTDFGFVDFAQIDMTSQDVLDRYAIQTCLSRVASTHRSGVNLRYSAEAMRRWYLQEAYLDRHPDGPDWVIPGYAVKERGYPLSAENLSIQAAMDFADCVVAEDPHSADYFFRTNQESDEEQQGIEYLLSSLGTCLPAGQQMEIDPAALRVWIGEALWHASNNIVSVDERAREDAE